MIVLLELMPGTLQLLKSGLVQSSLVPSFGGGMLVEVNSFC